MIKKIAVLTSGGDAPGMNNAIAAIVKQAKVLGLEPYIVKNGYAGLHAGEIEEATDIKVNRFITNGGTFISSSRFPEFKKPEVRLEAKAQLDKKGIDALVVIGGDGSYHGAQLLHEIGVKTIALPGTIDNDISSSELTIGYDTALNTIVESIDRIRDTMKSHNRAAIVEVMGHGCGDLALYSALATASEGVSINENILDKDEIVGIIKKTMLEGTKRSAIIIVSEFIYKDLIELEKYVSEKTGIVTRHIQLGHVQRGGRPTAMERINSSLMGIKAVDLLKEGKSGLAIGILEGKIKSTPILEALAMPSTNNKDLSIKINKLNQV